MSASTPLTSITPLCEHPQHIDTVARWIVDEWRDSTLEETKVTLVEAEGRPGALLALNGARPVGMLSFKRYPVPESGTDGLWINALYVVEPWRGRGVGSQLLRAGVVAARPLRCGTLYVYTDVPRFYMKHKWIQIRHDCETGMFILELAM